MSTLQEQLKETFKELYDSEIERQDKLLDRIVLASGILVVFGGLAGYFISTLERFYECPYSRWHLAFYIPVGLGVLSAAISLYYGVRAIQPSDYKYIDIGGIEFVIALARKDRMPDEDIGKGMPGLFADGYKKCVLVNRLHNIRRTGQVFKSIQFGILAVVLMVGAFPGHARLKQDLPDDPTKVTIVQPAKENK